jgi:hypothetical protein
MAIKILEPAELALRRTRGPIHEDYVDTLAKLQPGQGGELEVAHEGASRQTVKKRLEASSQAAGVRIQFIRSPEHLVVFEVLEPTAPTTPRRRGRPRKATTSQ